jgi:hypothetical protein
MRYRCWKRLANSQSSKDGSQLMEVNVFLQADHQKPSQADGAHRENRKRTAGVQPQMLGSLSIRPLSFVRMSRISKSAARWMHSTVIRNVAPENQVQLDFSSDAKLVDTFARQTIQLNRTAQFSHLTSPSIHTGPGTRDSNRGRSNQRVPYGSSSAHPAPVRSQGDDSRGRASQHRSSSDSHSAAGIASDAADARRGHRGRQSVRIRSVHHLPIPDGVIRFRARGSSRSWRLDSPVRALEEWSRRLLKASSFHVRQLRIDFLSDGPLISHYRENKGGGATRQDSGSPAERALPDLPERGLTAAKFNQEAASC